MVLTFKFEQNAKVYGSVICWYWAVLEWEKVECSPNLSVPQFFIYVFKQIRLASQSVLQLHLLAG